MALTGHIIQTHYSHTKIYIYVYNYKDNYNSSANYPTRNAWLVGSLYQTALTVAIPQTVKTCLKFVPKRIRLFECPLRIRGDNPVLGQAERVH